MSQQRRQPENNSDEDEADHRTSSDSDGLDLVPTLMKIKQIVFLRHSDFLRLLNEFNNTLELFTRDDPHYLQFTIVPHSNSTILWKALIRITCSKVCRADNSKSNEITLNLNQFLSVHQSLSQQISMLQKCPSSNLYNSASGNNNNQNSSSFSSAKLSFTVPNDNECCICMDRQPNLVLPCTHKFCDQCFQQWSSQTSATSSQTCPLCRVDITGDSGFLLAETPKYDNVKKMLTESILSLPVDYKSRSHDSPSMTRSHRE